MQKKGQKIEFFIKKRPILRFSGRFYIDNRFALMLKNKQIPQEQSIIFSHKIVSKK